ncbi:uncharacterized protein crybg2 [Centroberyx affinis]|uniref:uncharacterized protein crybg2 n=1 Tax=Centroberyx affinis TaxID=166261 RepID=UPI003A5C56BB
MAKKSSPKKTLKSLFSKSEANLKESAEKDEDRRGEGGEKKKFKLFKFKIKSKSGSVAEKPAHEDQRLQLSAAEPDRKAEDGDAWPDASSPDGKRSSLYATTPRSKVKDFSYSELDLRKPKKFGTFTFGLRKKKKKAEESFSKSTMGLHGPGIKEREEEPLDLSQSELDQAKKKVICMSQPELDTSDTFDIPSPPPAATNQSQSDIFFTNQSQSSVTLNNQPESQEPVMDGSDPFDVGKELSYRAQTDSALHHANPPSSLNLHSEPVGQDIDDFHKTSHSEMTLPHSGMTSDSFDPVREAVTSVPEVQNTAPPSSDCVRSPGTETQITDSKRRLVFVTVTNTTVTSANPDCPSPVPETMTAEKGQEIFGKFETLKEETFSVPSGQIDGYDVPHSPVYISVGSDDSSAMDVYFSAEEDNVEESGDEEMYTVEERVETSLSSSMVAETKEVHAEIPQQEKTAESERNNREKGDLKLIVEAEVKNEGGKTFYEDKPERLDGQIETEQKSSDQGAAVQGWENGSAVFLEDSDGRRQEEKESTKAWPQMKEEGEEERKEELLATPVQQVNALLECESALPSSKPHGQGEGPEGNWTTAIHNQTEDHRSRQTQLPGQQIDTHKDTRSTENIHNTSCNAEKEDTITHTLTEDREKIDTFREAEEQVVLTAEVEKTGAESKDSIQTNSSSTKSAKSSFTDADSEGRHNAITETTGGVEVVTGTLTHSAELRSDAREIEHNRAAQRSEWADTVTQSAGRASAVPEQVAVELSVTAADTHRPDTHRPDTHRPDTHHPDTQAADTHSERDHHPPAAHPNPPQGSLKASGVPRPALEVFASEIQAKMNSRYSTLSTTLSIKPSSPSHEGSDESKQRFHKVSLVTETDTTDLSQDTVDFRRPSTTAAEYNGTDQGSATPEYTWRNRFEAVSQYKPDLTEQSSLSDSLNSKVLNTDSGTSPLTSSALPEATVYTRHLTASPSSSPSLETHSSLGNRLSDRTGVYLSHESEPVRREDEWRRSVGEREELAAPAGERAGQRQREAEPEKIKSGWDSQQLPVSGFSAHQTSRDDNDGSRKEDDSSSFSGVFKATRVELVADPTIPSSSPISPDTGSPHQCDMESLVDTLKSMGPTQRLRSLRGPPQGLISALPPIVEDASSPTISNLPTSLTSLTKSPPAPGAPAEAPNGLYTLPADLGLKWCAPKETRSLLSQQEQAGDRGLNMPLRATASSSIVIRKPFDSSPEDLKSPLSNGNGLLQSSTGSRLDNSVLFSSYRPASIDQTLENGKANPLAQRSLFRTASLPEMGPSYDRISVGPNTGTDPTASRYERFSFLLNSSSSTSGSLTGAEDPNARMSRPLQLSINSPPSSNSPTHLLSPTAPLELHRPIFTADLSMFGQTQGMGMGMGAGTGAVGTHVLQRSFSSEGSLGVPQSPLFNSVHGGSHLQIQEPEPEKAVVPKYRAFPDAYLTKEKEHGKLNPRPGKMYIFDRTGMCGQRIEVRSDVIDATPWQLQETISIRVVRGGWVLYEKPNFKGEKVALDEGDIELTCPFNPPEEEEQQLQNGQKENGTSNQNSEQNSEKSDGKTEETKPARKFIIGSIRRAVRDYSVPEISLFPEENAEGKKVIFRDTSDDARIFGFPIKANSIIINAGLWLVYAQPFFQGVPRVLEVGGYTNPAAWGVEQPYVASVHPLKIGEPRVESPNDPKMVIYDKPYFSGKSRTINANMRDFMTRTDRQQTAFMYSVGSLKVLGGVWVGYEKEGFRGHQYLLEEGEYHDWRVWGGCDAELRSARVIRADLTDPLLVMYEQPEEEQEEMQENTFEVTEAIPDVELFGYKTTTRSIHVLSGAWIAYSHVDFSGNQYILEKGFYNNCADWGSEDTHICSIQPVLLAPVESSKSGNEIMLYSEPDYQGECHVCYENQEAVSDKLLAKSCRVVGGSWVLYEAKQYTGNLYVLSEGDYPNFTSMGCPASCTIRSVKAVPMMFSIPSISLFGLECHEGREITTDMEVVSMVEEGYNNHILSLRVNSGCWVICEHSNYRGRQFLLEPIEITNWPKFSSLQTIGSMYPVRQKRRFIRIKNKERGHYLSIQGGVEEMKTGRVVVTPQVEGISDIWFYQDGLIKNKISPTMSLQVMGNIEPAAKVVLWSETRQPIQTWTAQTRGTIVSLNFPGMVLDVKGGKTYDKDHVVIMPENEERPSQQWELELL